MTRGETPADGSCRREERLSNNQLDERPKRGVTQGDIPMRGRGTFNDDIPSYRCKRKTIMSARYIVFSNLVRFLYIPEEEGHGKVNKSDCDGNEGGGQ